MGIISVIFSRPRCVFCRHPIKNYSTNLICDTCTHNLPYTEREINVPGDYYSFCSAPLYNEGVVYESLKRFRDNNASGYAETYGKIVANFIQDKLYGKYDLISWVPLSEVRLKERGYDQSMLLALATALELGDVAVCTLEKHIDVVRQSIAGSIEKRKANVSGAFRAVDPELISNKQILLVDDSVSTGSTLSECAKTLLEAGASEILCVALAMSRELDD